MIFLILNYSISNEQLNINVYNKIVHNLIKNNLV